MYLLIDDERDLNCDIICRTGELGLMALRALADQVTVLVIDHDLGEGISGYQVINQAIQENLLPDEVQISSNNTVGILNIGRALEDAGYVPHPSYTKFFKDVDKGN